MALIHYQKHKERKEQRKEVFSLIYIANAYGFAVCTFPKISVYVSQKHYAIFFCTILLSWLKLWGEKVTQNTKKNINNLFQNALSEHKIEHKLQFWEVCSCNAFTYVVL